ncbi:ATP-binding cassette domain-containing protein [Microbacter sp. GSS18]|nr:ATP-binding cassette domain-containing protein [Microbacter sp. GSS18]
MLEINNVSKRFRTLGKPDVVALDDVSLEVQTGQVVGLVGESGSGKSTLLRIVMRLERADAGKVVQDGASVLTARGADLKAYRRKTQMVFQNPMGSLSPRLTVAQIIEEGMRVHGLHPTSSARRRRVGELLEMVGMNAADASRYPASFSGGQRQRIAIARALSVEPDLLVCDEAVSALDVSVQAQVLNVLKEMHRELGLSILFIAHDLAVVRYLCSHVYVMQSGRIVESGPAETIFAAPRHPYTRELLEAVPIPDPSSDWLTRGNSHTTEGVTSAPQP